MARTRLGRPWIVGSTFYLAVASPHTHAAHAAPAPESAIALDLDVEPGQNPTYLCVVTARGTRIENREYSLPILALEKGALDDQVDAGGERRFRSAPTDELAKEIATPHRQAIKGALKVLMRTPTSDSCSSEYAECTPRLSIASTREWFSRHVGGEKSETLHLTCGKDESSTAVGVQNGERVAILSLDFIQGEDRSITEVRLAGSGASLVVRGTLAGSEVAAIRVIGGDYLPGISRFTTGQRAVVPLRARCTVRPVLLPPVNLVTGQGDTDGIRSAAPESAGVELKRALDLIRACKPTVVSNQFGLRVPRSTTYEDYALVVTSATARATAAWSGGDPPLSISTELDRVTFAWEPDCTYPLDPDGCPDAYLDGVFCPRDDHNDSCTYTCSTTGVFDLPATASFRKEPRVWTSRLTFPGQTITDYIPRIDRTIRVSFPKWADLPIIERGSIRGVEFAFPNGKRETVSVGLELNGPVHQAVRNVELPVPHLSCNSELRYRILSNRLTDFAPIDVKNGIASVPAPECNSMEKRPSDGPCFTFRTAVTAGLLDRRDDVAQLPSDPYTSLNAGVNFVAEYLPWGDWWFGQFGYGAMVGTREYIGDDGMVRNSNAAGYARLAATLAIGTRTPEIRPILRTLRIGLGISGGYGHAIERGDASAVGGDFFFSPFGLVGWGSFAVAIRMMFGEELDEIDSRTGERIRDRKSRTVGYELQYFF